MKSTDTKGTVMYQYVVSHVESDSIIVCRGCPDHPLLGAVSAEEEAHRVAEKLLDAQAQREGGLCATVKTLRTITPQLERARVLAADAGNDDDRAYKVTDVGSGLAITAYKQAAAQKASRK